MTTARTKRTKIVLTAVSLFCGALLSLGISTGCEYGGFPTIVNQRNQEIRIFVSIVSGKDVNHPGEEIDYGTVPPNSTRELASITFVYPDWVSRIQARDPTGKVVFSHDYKRSDLEKIGWKITIPP